jgi:peptide chain release factor 2
LLGNSARKEIILEPSYERADARVRAIGGTSAEHLSSFVICWTDRTVSVPSCAMHSRAQRSTHRIAARISSAMPWPPTCCARWAEKRGYKVSVVEVSAGEEAGIKSATLLIKGANAYGWLKTESGVHRLVRISPYDSNARRHTSFASAWVYPLVDENIEIDVKEGDCRIDTYRASGAGGQHVNTTDSAVRITHIPTNIVVASQQERSQIKNRAIAWAMLKSRLYEMELKRREEKASAEAAAKTEIGWGHQIRSYVLQPYQLVKDLRTGVQSTDPQAVLDGDLDDFVEASLAQRVSGSEAAVVEDLD